MHLIFNQLHCEGNGFLDRCGLANKGSVTSKIDHLWKTNRPHHPHHNQSKVATDAAQLREMVHQEDNARVEARVFSTRPPDHNCARPTDRQTGADADEQRRYVLPSFLPVTSSYSLSAIAHRARLHNPPNQPHSVLLVGCLHQSLRSLGKEEKLKRGTPNEIRVRVPIAEHHRRMNIAASIQMD